MTPLSLPDIEAELSYAYLHAVATQAQFECKVSQRHSDNRGIDAQLTAWAPFKDGGYQTEVALNVQLKATVKEPATPDGHFLSYFFRGLDRYDDLRMATIAIPRILVVLFLPPDRDQWLTVTPDELILRKCAYWQSLRGAPKVTGRTGITVYLPKTQLFTADALRSLATELSHNRVPEYQVP